MSGFRWQCPNCGHNFARRDIHAPIRCKSPCNLYDAEGKYLTYLPDYEPPPRVQRAVRHISATARWYEAGCPTRTDDQVVEIYQNFCQPCKYLVDGICTHRRCGCNIRTVEEERESVLSLILPSAMLNKVRMATEHCPIKLW